MTGSYFVGRLREHYGMNVLVAEGEHEANVHDALYGELAKRMFLPTTPEKFKAAIADLVRRGARAVIFGCTQFGMLLEAGNSPVPLIDTTLAHAQAAVEMALQEQAAFEAAAQPAQTSDVPGNGSRTGMAPRCVPACTRV